MNLRERIKEALFEDLGSGDVTTQALIDPHCHSQASFIAKQDGILAGLLLAVEVFKILDPQLLVEVLVKDGSAVGPGQVLAHLEGNARALLTGERTALNLLCHLSGIASLTHQLVVKLKPYSVRLLDTRKTTPLWRDLEKYAVRMGGGFNHRFGLYDMVLIKDNHVAACGGITPALRRIRSGLRPGLQVEIEVKSFAEFEQALAEGANWVMLDNMSVQEMEQCVKLGKGRVILEASGGIREDTVDRIARTGVDCISLGALTHSAPALDISLEIEENTSHAAQSAETSGVPLPEWNH
jgi:nicotinate-nucleotide pyrophosphorylase (carboxylating)